MSMADAWQARRARRALYWWQPQDGRINVGDHLSKVVVEAMLALRDLELVHKRDRSRRLFAVGSILHNARDGETVWGSGINAKIPGHAHRFRNLDVRAVRGALTRRWLLERGIPAPSVYGDPALLMSAFYSRDLIGASGPKDFVVVPHFNEPIGKYAAWQDHLLLPSTPPLAFVRGLLGAKRVVSSSLHGVILAEAYGIPAVYLDSGNGENRFKYDDYYSGTGRGTWHAGRCVEECLDLGGNAPFDVAGLQKGLRDAFPYDLW